jgi:transcription antitermination factor NusG
LIRRAALEPLNPGRPLPHGCTWYVLTTNPQREYTVQHWLEDQERNWFTLVPLDKRWRLTDRRSGGKNKKREAYMVPLLPRMVIAGFREPPPWLYILDHQHITGVLGINHEPIPLRQGEPELLRAISYALAAKGPAHAIAPGGKALVTCPGPLQGAMVEVGTLKGKKAVITAIFDGMDKKGLPFVMEALIDDLQAA